MIREAYSGPRPVSKYVIISSHLSVWPAIASSSESFFYIQEILCNRLSSFTSSSKRIWMALAFDCAAKVVWRDVQTAWEVVHCQYIIGKRGINTTEKKIVLGFPYIKGWVWLHGAITVRNFLCGHFNSAINIAKHFLTFETEKHARFPIWKIGAGKFGDIDAGRRIEYR